MIGQTSIRQIEADIAEEFALLDDWADKYTYLIELGKEVPMLPDDARTDSNLVRGCQSRVWIVSQIEEDTVVFLGDSDALITRGLLALLIRLLSGQPAQEIVRAGLSVLDRIGLRGHLSPTRANGLAAMIDRMRTDAALLMARQNA